MALQTDEHGFTNADERKAIEAYARILGAVTIANWLNFKSHQRQEQEWYLLTAWGFKRVRYITADGDCVTNPGSSYLDQQTFSIHHGMLLYPATGLRKFHLL